MYRIACLFDSPRNIFRFFIMLTLVLAAFCFLAARSAYTITVLEQGAATIAPTQNYHIDIIDEHYSSRRTYITLRAYDRQTEDIVGIYNKVLALRDTETGDILLIPTEMVISSQVKDHVEPIPIATHDFTRLNNQQIALRGFIPMKKLPGPHERYEICVLLDGKAQPPLLLPTGVHLLQSQRSN